jgi:hypothetical protein
LQVVPSTTCLFLLAIEFHATFLTNCSTHITLPTHQRVPCSHSSSIVSQHPLHHVCSMLHTHPQILLFVNVRFQLPWYALSIVIHRWLATNVFVFLATFGCYSLSCLLLFGCFFKVSSPLLSFLIFPLNCKVISFFFRQI